MGIFVQVCHGICTQHGMQAIHIHIEYSNLLHDSLGVLCEDSHLAKVALACLVALEAILISTLLLAHLTVPAKLL